MRFTFGCFASAGLLINSVFSSLNSAGNEEYEVMDLTDFKKSGKEFLVSDDGELIQCFLAINKQTNPAFEQFLSIFTTVAKNFSKNFSSFKVNFSFIDSGSRVKYGPLFNEFKIRPESGVKLIMMKMNMKKPSRPKFYDSNFEHHFYEAIRENEYLQEMEDFIMNALTGVQPARGEKFEL